MEQTSSNTMEDLTHTDESGNDKGEKKTSPPNPFRIVWDTVQVWATNTTFHCIKYVFDKNCIIARRLFWLVVIVGMCYGLVTGYISQINRYRSFRAITKDTIRFEDQLQFPSMTICSHCRIQNNTWTEQWEKQVFDAYMEAMRTSVDIRTLTHHFGNVSLDGIKMPDLFRKMKVTPDRLFYTCSWQGVPFECTERMKPHFIAHGHCYTFNYKEKADEFVVQTIGTHSALSMVLFIDQDNCYIGDQAGGAGVEYLVHDDGEPNFERATSLSPGFHHNIAITKHEKKHLPPPVKAFGDTECLDTSGDFQNPLKYFSNYSMQACEQECYSDFVNRACGCVSYFLSDAIARCDVSTEINCTYAAYGRFWQRYHEYVRECGCKMSCTTTTYTAHVSSAYIPNKHFRLLPKENVSRGLDFSDKDYIRENFLSVEVYFDSKMVHVSEQILEFTQEDLAAAFGGYLGLAVGASLMTLLEIIEMIVIAIIRCFCHLGRAR